MPSKRRTWEGLRAYLAAPFPRAEGFHPYRMPGPAVHLPILGMLAGAGFWLCWSPPWLRPLVAVYLLAGLYGGRDLAILAHYNCLLLPLTWLLAFGALTVMPRLEAAGPPPLWLSLAVTAGVTLLFASVLAKAAGLWASGEENSAERGEGA